MPTFTYTPALENDSAPPLVAPYQPAYEIDTAQTLLGISLEPALEIDEALPFYRRGATYPELIVMCGLGTKEISGQPNPDGSYETVVQDLIPTHSGIPAVEGLLYGFSINLKLMNRTATYVGIMWFASPGGVADQIGTKESDPYTPPNNEWHLYTVQDFPPVNPAPGSFLIPYVRVTNAVGDIPFYMAGAQVYAQGGSGTVVAFAPDRYITLGDPGEKLGGDFLLGKQ